MTVEGTEFQWQAIVYEWVFLKVSLALNEHSLVCNLSELFSVMTYVSSESVLSRERS